MTNDTINHTPNPTLEGSLAEGPSIPAALIDPRPGLAAALATATEVIEAVKPADLDRTTPCDDMDIRALLGHLVMVAQRIATAARRVPAEEWPEDVTGLADDAWARAWRDAARDAVASWTDDALLGPDMVLPWATMPGREVVGIYTNEVIVHAWDLAQTLGRELVWDEEALEVADAAIRIQLPDADRTEMWAGVAASLPPEVPWADPFANAVPISDDAPRIDQLIAWNGRQP